MSGRSGLVGPSGGSMAGPDPANQPMDLVKTTGRSMESGSIVKSGNTTLVHYTTGGVAQILTTSVATAHVVTAKPVGRSESMGVGSQTVTLVSRTSGPPAALNLAAQNPGGGSNPAVRTVSHPSGTQTNNAVVTSSTQLAYHIPRGAAAVANMSAPRSQTVATPIVRTTGQPLGHPSSNLPGPRSSVGGQRVVPASSAGWGRSTPSPAHSNKGAPTLHSNVAGTSLSLGVARGSLPSTRPGQPTGSITTYHPGGRASGLPGGPIRGAGTTTMRGMVTDGPRMSGPKAVHITQPVVQPQKYGSGIMGSGGRSMAPGSSASSAGPIYTPGSPLVTTVAGQNLTSQGSMRTQPPPAIAVRITTAPIPTSSTSAPAGTGIGALALTSPTGTTSGTILTHHPTLQRTSQDHHIPLKAPIVRTPGGTHQPSKAGVQGQTLTFPDGPKVITQPAQGPPLALTHISGLSGLTTQKGQVGTHTLQQQQQHQQQQQQQQPQHQQQHHQHQHQQAHLQHQQQQHQQQQHHSTGVQHRGGSVVGATVGRGIGGTAIPVAKVLPQQAPPQGPVSVASTPRVPHGQVRAPSPGQVADPQPAHTSVFLHRTHAGVAVTTGGTCGERVVTTVPQYSIAPQYYYEQGHNATYQVGGTTLVPSTLGSTHYVPASMQGGSLRVTAGGSNPTVANVGGVNGSGQVECATGQQGTVPLPSMKPNASPRPSILRKRPDNDGIPMKAAKNLTTSLSMPVPSPPSPKRPDSRGNGNASSGSTTISANSSPDSSLSGLQIEEMDSGTTPLRGSGSHTPPSIKQEPPEDATIVLPRPPSLSIPAPDLCPLTLNTMSTATLTVPQPHLSVATLHAPAQILGDGLSPRKKPRKQQLMGNELQEARSSEDDLEHPPIKKNKRDLAEDSHDLEGSEDEGGGWSEPGGASSGGSCGGGGGSGGLGGVSSSTGAGINNSVSTTVVLTNRPTMSLLSSFRQTWKPRHNHFVRHTDVKPKDEKRMTVNEIANQKLAMQRVNGWKIVHLSGQVDDLVELETDVVDRLHLLLSSLEKRTHPRKPYKDFEKDVNRLSELVKANIQRSKIIKDQMVEARSQMHKLFDHKDKIVDIMNKYSSKRSVRKKEKS
ncbi:histone deacetylase complex subunit SAP130-A-like isoform X2 [Eriocheir sinensis]|uniref:histone deacetylase complex subunit SAP130-A-like isoform X2 n=1 Tax=Eriocheir sinensis TaxID=95602 RepID=UPI0021C712FE|nr:histone deacetylase complex subunit SAP130-A-like isoform X2 [Eriocheir sinensis]